MGTLSYHTSAAFSAGLPRRTLIAGISALGLLMVYDFLCWFLADYPFPPPDWLKTRYPWMFVPVLVALHAGLSNLSHLSYGPKHPFRFVFALLLTLALLASPALPVLAPLPPERCGGPQDVIAARARGIAISSIVYAEDHAGHYPPHPAVLLLTGQIEPKEFGNYDLPLYKLPTPVPPEASWPSIAASVEACSTFVYTGADLVDPKLTLPSHENSLSADIIILYSKKCRVMRDRTVIAFADGHANRVPTADLAGYFAASNAARTRLGLPSFAYGSPPPAPPAR